MKNVPIYSFSRDRILRACPRKYWFLVYRSWRGWWWRGRPPESSASEDAYRAKFIDSTDAFMGRVFHEAAARGLRMALDGEWTAEDARSRLLRWAASRIDSGLKQARSRSGSDPKKSTRILEIEHGEVIDEQEIRDAVRRRIMVLTGDGAAWTGEYGGINLYTRAAASGRILMIDERVKYRPDWSPVDIYLACDLVVRGTDRRMVAIIDWKTGKPVVGHDDQMVGYGAWAILRGWRKIALIKSYVGDESVVTTKTFTDGREIDAHRLTVLSFVDNVRSRLVDADLERNEAVEDRFEPSPGWQCDSCEFSRLCGHARSRRAGTDR